VYPDQECS